MPRHPLEAEINVGALMKIGRYLITSSAMGFFPSLFYSFHSETAKITTAGRAKSRSDICVTHPKSPNVKLTKLFLSLLLLQSILYRTVGEKILQTGISSLETNSHQESRHP